MKGGNKDKICFVKNRILKIDCDDPKKISKFKELLDEIVDDVVFIPKSVKFDIRGNR